MMKEFMLQDQIKSQNNYITTSALAKFCGLSRFTIINWVNQGKIKTIRTPGGHSRISFSEVISFLETLHINKEKRGIVSGPPSYCWEYVEKTGCEKKCRNCLIYKKKVDFCFLLVRHFGKEAISCEGNCLDCGYFNKFFNKKKIAKKPSNKKNSSSSRLNVVCKDSVEETKNIVECFSYTLGSSIRGLKKGIVNLRDMFTDI